MPCGYADVGCETLCPQGDLAAHERDGVVAHVGLLRQRLAHTTDELTQCRTDQARTEAALSQTQHDLAQTKADLERTRDDLAATRQELERTQAELAAFRARLDQLRSSSSFLVPLAVRPRAQIAPVLSAATRQQQQPSPPQPARLPSPPMLTDSLLPRRPSTPASPPLSQSPPSPQLPHAEATARPGWRENSSSPPPPAASASSSPEAFRRLASELVQTGSSQYSICFDLTNRGTRRCRILSIHFGRRGECTGVNVQIFCTRDRRGGFEAAQHAAHWQLIAQGTRDFAGYCGGRTGLCPFALGVPLELESGERVGVWIQTSDSHGVQFFGDDVPLGTVSMQDANLLVTVGPYGNSIVPFISRRSNRRLTGTIIDYQLLE
ncbi:hypothetical protein PAPYR_6604 [Paratrimastix pyriformis]|uniref:SPRY domain-containing protein n=1 Tax=Paratrimastix pyriformis TaxID=342808 RepID=A0ABQ8UHB0_9EUKA|nr:hypothetical protein PAPYR_6604 [Paratrimastix pyriformis]